MDNLIQRARAFALKAHEGQTYGELPYEFHLRNVANILAEAQYEPLVVAAGWLHDVVEDTSVTLFQIREEFGGNMARIIDACTDEPGEERKERKRKTYEKLRVCGAKARAVKLADRIANMQACIENEKRAAKYLGEFPDFIRACGTDEQNAALTLKAFQLYMDAQTAWGKQF